jgi:nucleotide-binding universal stress UspA family protein
VGERKFELGTDGPRVIVVGVDGSPTSLRAVAFAAGVARRERAELVCVYVRPVVPVSLALSDWAGVAVQAEVDAVSQVETEVHERIADDVTAWGTGARMVVRDGEPLAELTAVAAELGADAIVVGASTSAGHRLFGSLASRLLRQCRWPVTVVP